MTQKSGKIHINHTSAYPALLSSVAGRASCAVNVSQTEDVGSMNSFQDGSRQYELREQAKLRPQGLTNLFGLFSSASATSD